jgi:hypothetical protein
MRKFAVFQKQNSYHLQRPQKISKSSCKTFYDITKQIKPLEIFVNKVLPSTNQDESSNLFPRYRCIICTIFVGCIRNNRFKKFPTHIKKSSNRHQRCHQNSLWKSLDIAGVISF